PRTAPAYGVIGAGPCGLTACKNLLQQGFEVECLEAREDLGGIWNLAAGRTAAYPSVSMITSKRLSAFADHPMPSGLPPFPSQTQAIDYLQSYADRFQLRKHIEFGMRVERAEPQADGWSVQVVGESAPRHYRGLIVASGHHWEPLMPSWSGTFDGRLMHAFDYTSPQEFEGQRVLVVGAGNTGCDLASEISRYAADTALSLRRGYHFLPKFMWGAPIDRCGEAFARWRLPLFIYRAIAGCLLRIAIGSPVRYGLPKPEHRLFEAHPIINSQLLYDVGHGRVRIRPDVNRLDGSQVCFKDGTDDPFDTIICATGYRPEFPFLPPGQMDNLYLNVFHRERNDLFAVGLIQPSGSIWSLADYQSQLIAKVLLAARDDRPTAATFAQAKRRDGYRSNIRYLSSDRHRLEVEYFGYERSLKTHLARF
ncbi:MAG: NAD(P)-binding domain-containing protein, partial [Planctomycetota bacterium]